MIIHPRVLLAMWGLIAAAFCHRSVRAGIEATRAARELLSILREGYQVSCVDALMVFGGFIVAALFLSGGIYAAWKFRELLEGK